MGESYDSETVRGQVWAGHQAGLPRPFAVGFFDLSQIGVESVEKKSILRPVSSGGL